MRSAQRMSLGKVASIVLVVMVAGQFGATSGLAETTAVGPVNEADVQRFVERWSARVRDSAWMDAYTNSEGLSAELQAEGFHARAPEVQAVLVERLFQHFLATVPEFRAEIDALGEAGPQRLREMQDTMRLLIFEKDAWRASMQASMADEPKGAPTPAPEGEAQRLNAPLADAPSIEVAALPAEPLSVGETPLVPTPPLAVAPPELDLEVLPDATEVQPHFLPDLEFAFPWDVPAQAQEQELSILDLAGVAGEQLPAHVAVARPAALAGELEGAEEALPDLTVSVPSAMASDSPPSNPGALQAFARALTYSACGQMGPTGTVRCFPQSVPFGVPIGLDVDGSPTTGVGGIDVVVQVTPLIVPGAAAWVPGVPPSPPPIPVEPPTASPSAVQRWLSENAAAMRAMAEDGAVPGIAVTMRVHVLPAAPSVIRSLGAKVWAVYGIADANNGAVDKLVRVGVDGSEPGTKLPTLTLLTAQVKDLPALLDGQVRAGLDLSFQQAGSSVALFAGYHDTTSSGAPVDPTTVTLRLQPVVDLSVDLDMLMDGSHLVGTVTTPKQTKVTVTFDQQQTSPPSTTKAEAVIDQLPTDVRVEYTDLGDDFAVQYDASSSIGLITANFRRADTTTVAGTLLIQGLPDRITATVRPGSAKGSLEYDASGVVPLVAGTFSRTSSEGTTSGAVSIGNVPARFDVRWDRTVSPAVVVYDASSSLGPVTASLTSGPGKLAFTAGIQSLPPYMQFRFRDDFAEFDARTSAAGAVGSASVGSITFNMGSDGTLLAGPFPAEDHFLVQQPSPGVTRAALKYTGLAYAKADLANDQVHAEVRNSAPRFFRYSFDTPGALVKGHIDKIPQRIAIDIVGETYTYNAFGAGIAQILAEFNNKAATPITAVVDIRGIPALVSLTLDMDGKQLLYSASSPVTSINVQATVPTTTTGTWSLSLAIAGIPTSWSVKFPDGAFVYDSPTGIGSITLAANNKGGSTLGLCGLVSINPVVVVPNHLCANLNLLTQQFDAKFSIVQVKHVEFRELAKGVLVDVGAGGGIRFVGSLDATLPRSGLFGGVGNNDRATVAFSIDPLPTSVRLETGELTKYTASSNFDLSIDAAYGSAQAFTSVPAPPVYALGASVRDGTALSCSFVCISLGSAIKAAVRLTGVPTSLEIGTKDVAGVKTETFSATNWRPKSSQLVVDAELDNILSPAVDALVVQNGIPTTQAVNLGFTSSTTTLGDGSKRITITGNAAPGLGLLTADIKVGTNAGRLEVSNIPATLSAVVTLGDDTKTVAIGNSAAISRIYAGLKASVSDASFSGAVELLDVPATVTLSFGKVTVTPASGETYTAPGLTYSASASTLDINAFVTAALLGGDLTAAASLNVQNLGASTSMTLSGKTLSVASTPATTLLEIHVWGQYRKLYNFDGCWPSDCPWLRIQYGSHAGINPLTIKDFMLRLTSFSSLTMRLGISSSVQGSYGTFKLGWDDISVFVDVEAFVKAVADFGALGDINLYIVGPITIHQTLTLDVLFHIAGNHMSSGASFWHYDTPGIVCGCDWGGCSDYDIHVDIKPHPHSYSWNGFTLTPASSGEGSAWIVTPDPWDIIPDKIVQTAAALTSPLGGGFDVSAPCH